MSPATVIRRDKVTGAFLSKPGGWFEMNSFLYEVVAVPKDSSARMIEVECAEAPVGWTEEREREIIVKHGRVVLPPPGS